MGTFDLDPPPAVVEEAEERLHQVGEVLVEAPLVVLVLALEAPQYPLQRVACVARQGRRAAAERLWQLQPGVEALAQPPHERQRSRIAHAAATQSRTASVVE